MLACRRPPLIPIPCTAWTHWALSRSRLLLCFAMRRPALLTGHELPPSPSLLNSPMGSALRLSIRIFQAAELQLPRPAPPFAILCGRSAHMPLSSSMCSDRHSMLARAQNTSPASLLVESPYTCRRLRLINTTQIYNLTRSLEKCATITNLLSIVMS
jgi:hypothetical protein